MDIIILFFVCRRIAALAKQKGMSSTRWIIITILAWIVAEMFGILVALMFFTADNLISIMLVAILFGVASFHLVRSFLQNFPDKDQQV